ncbi:hypothetical protein BM1_02832 [Bipolaris maydis]|nr:hypothetical protein BM1_02832 [Bipolaris maydis]
MEQIRRLGAHDMFSVPTNRRLPTTLGAPQKNSAYPGQDSLRYWPLGPHTVTLPGTTRNTSTTLQSSTTPMDA